MQVRHLEGVRMQSLVTVNFTSFADFLSNRKPGWTQHINLMCFNLIG